MLYSFYENGGGSMLIPRKNYIDRLNSFKDTRLIKVLTGIRRCGKSTLFELFINQLQQQGISHQQIVSVNLEDASFRQLKTAEQLYDYIEPKLQAHRKNYVFIDEIQQIENFERAADWLFVKDDVDLYITGSNAFLLSGELATLLSGRYVEIKVQPLSFSEYCSCFPSQEPSRLYPDYLTRSSFPGALELSRPQDIHLYLDGIFNTILLKDIITRHKISSPDTLRAVIEFMFDNIGNLSSVTKITNTLKSSGRNVSAPTVETYLSALEDSFVLYRVPRYDVKGKQRLTSGNKYYVSDIGLRYYLLGPSNTDIGHILENIVYLELLRRGYEVFIGKAGDGEIDFIAFTDSGPEYYQVTQTVLEQTTLQRELRPLQQLRDNYPKHLISMDYLPPTSYDGIKQINALEWLLAI